MQNLLWYDALTNSCFCACENDIRHFQDKVKNGFEEKEQPMTKIETHAAICKELTDLYERKNADYGDSFAELRKEFPNSITYRLTDKLNRLKKLYDPEHQQQVKDESVDDTLKDIANYAILELIERGYEPDYENVTNITPNKRFHRVFSISNENYSDNDGRNLYYLHLVEQTVNNTLQGRTTDTTNGWVFLNEVLVPLGFKPTAEGFQYGWVYSKFDQKYMNTRIEFEIRSIPIYTPMRYNLFFDCVRIDFEKDLNIGSEITVRG